MMQRLTNQRDPPIVTYPGVVKRRCD